jgi:hypothetical protein
MFCCVAVALTVAGVAFGKPNKEGTKVGNLVRPADFGQAGMGGGSAAGFPKCESTGWEALEPLCAWEAGLGLCGSTFICRDRNVDPPYPACSAAPIVNPDNCCVLHPHPVNDWFMSGSSQHCQEPHIDTINPAGGTQHMRFARSTLGGNPAGCTTTDVATGTACRESAFSPNINPLSPGTPLNPGVTSTSIDVARSQPAGGLGMVIKFSNQSNTEGFIGQLIFFDYEGYIFAADYALGVYAYIGSFQDTAYHNISFTYDVCGDELTYSFDGDLVYTTTWAGGSEIQGIEQYVWLGDNSGTTVFDFDNFSVTRITEPFGGCPCVCGDGVVCNLAEECDAGGGVFGDDDCCPGQCNPLTCMCPDPTNTLEDCAPRPVANGVNGPYITDGGFYSYVADAPFTSIETCGSDFDTQIFWNVTVDCGQYANFNDECVPSTFGGYQDAGDPNASCFQNSGYPLDSCLCVATPPGPYTFLVGEYDAANFSTFIPPRCSSTLVTITKKTSCALGGPIPGGACCNQLTGNCTDGVEPGACTGQYDVYSDNKLCSMVPCVALTGACCNRAPGAGGACVETTQAECPTSQYQSWTINADCDDVPCDEVTGSCCNTLSGTCVTGVTQSQCGPGADFVWAVNGTCSACLARPGACCVEPSVTEAICTDGQTLAQCNAAGGLWSDSQSCSAVECVPNFIPIPTVSEWGLAVLALLLLVLGKIYFARLPASAARQ